MITPTIIITDIDVKSILDRFSANRKACSILLQLNGIITAANSMQQMYQRSGDIAKKSVILRRGVMDTVDPNKNLSSANAAYQFFTNVVFANGLCRAIKSFYDGLDIAPEFARNLIPTNEEIGDFIALVATNAPKPWEDSLDGTGANEMLLACLNDLTNVFSDLAANGENVIIGIYTEDTPEAKGEPFIYSIPYKDISKNVETFIESFNS